MRKRIISIVLCVTMIISLAACGSGTPGKESKASDAPKTEAASTAPQTEPGGTKEPETSDAQQPEKLMAIVDKEGKRLGAIDADSACSAADGGVFDMLKFGLMKAVGFLMSKKKREAVPATFYDYKEMRDARPRAKVAHLLIVGGVMIALAAVALVMYGRYEPIG